MKFTLEIEIDAMRTGEDIARVLRNVATQLATLDEDRLNHLTPSDNWSIHDINGNRLGSCAVTGSREVTR
jgi:hypothetical protein